MRFFRRKPKTPARSAVPDARVAPATADDLVDGLRTWAVHVEIVNDTLVVCPTWRDWRTLMRSRYLMDDPDFVPANQTKPFTGRYH